MNRLKLKGKLLLCICAMLFLALSISISIISVKTYNLSRQEALDKTLAIANQYAVDVANQINKPLSGARTLAQIFSGMKEMKTIPDRESLSSMMKEILLQNPDFFGVWTVWEPNALDGKDKEFAGSKAHDETGRFLPYWNRTGGIHIEPCVGYEDGTTTGYYTKPRKTGRELVTEPATYAIGGQQVTVVSACAPIMYKDTFIGLTGCDFSMKTMKEMVNAIKPYPGAYAMIITNTGIIAAHPDPKMIGKNAKEFISAANYQAIQRGEDIGEQYLDPATDTKNMRFFAPIHLGYTDEPWSLAIFVPMNEVMARANTLNSINLIVGIATLCVLIISVYLVTEFVVVRRVNKVVTGLRNIAEGDADTTKRLDETSIDEMGDLARAFNLVIKRFNGLLKNTKGHALQSDDSSSSLHQTARAMTNEIDQVSAKSGIVFTATDNMNTNITSVAEAMEEASANIGVVASSVEELTSTISEIATNSEQAKTISQKAVNMTVQTSESMDDLGKAAKQIDLVTETIKEISEQTNLLALNATIEAARAGEAGKGFAVVASEIKDLAQKTGSATHEIQERVEGIQHTSKKAIVEIQDITNVMGNMNTIVSNIASAVEEQSISTTEISANIANASTETNSVGENMKLVKSNSDEIAYEIKQLDLAIQKVSDYSKDVKDEATSLSSLTAKMSKEVAAFKV